jgi:hypothetical protein
MQNARPSAMRDLRRDWDGWSQWERRAVLGLAIASFACSVFWLVMTVGMMF